MLENRRKLLKNLGIRLFYTSLGAFYLENAHATIDKPIKKLPHRQRLYWAATWQKEHDFYVGALTSHAPQAHTHHVQTPQILQSLQVPTRAHGVLWDKTGSVYVLARRPGNWLLHFNPFNAKSSKNTRWHWLQAPYTYNGHALLSPDGLYLLTTQTNQVTHQGFINVISTKTFETVYQWETKGKDPHHMLWDKTKPHHVWVANGGIETAPESGRKKINLEHMDSSLVCMNVPTGHIVQQYTAPDPRLSLRHLAWCGDTLGVAMQAQYDDIIARNNAPILAILHQDQLQMITLPSEFNRHDGYAGDIASDGYNFYVSFPKGNFLATISEQGTFLSAITQDKVCALSTVTGKNQPNSLIALGNNIISISDGLYQASSRDFQKIAWANGIQFDNHLAISEYSHSAALAPQATIV